MMLAVDHHPLPTEGYPILAARLGPSTAVAEAVRASLTLYSSRSVIGINFRAPKVFLTLHKRAEAIGAEEPSPHGALLPVKDKWNFLYSIDVIGSAV
jgi:hypothetical protein